MKSSSQCASGYSAAELRLIRRARRTSASRVSPVGVAAGSHRARCHLSAYVPGAAADRPGTGPATLDRTGDLLLNPATDSDDPH